HHNGEGRGRLLKGQRGGVRVRPQNVRTALDQLASQSRKPVRPPLAITIVDEDVLLLHVAEVVQSLLEGKDAGCEVLSGGWFEHPDLRNFRHLLGFATERRENQADDKRDREPEQLHRTPRFGWLAGV